MAIEAHIFVIAPQPIDLSKWVILEKFQSIFCMTKTMIEISSMIRKRRGSTKRRWLRFAPGNWRAKSLGPNNL